MYCPSCGKEIPDISAFCLRCGKPIASLSEKIEFEYREFRLDMTKADKELWVPTETYTTVAARAHFWQAVQAVVMPELQNKIDEGWQPITEIGPAMVQLGKKSASFLGSKPDRHVFNAILLKLRRPKKA